MINGCKYIILLICDMCTLLFARSGDSATVVTRQPLNFELSLLYFQVPSSRPNPDDSKRSSGDVSSISVWLVSGLIVSTLFIVIIVGFLIARRSNSR